ncbi:HAD family hydrolase [Pelagibius marinus]|uniref:HAD family hydrolase n=1 Tax=Pelagibius marinus TaxID=2762760 RepID=UPI0029CA007A|nr:HAD family hydrolase [Pelagibius marinus]
MKIEGILFDKDGTLLDYDATWAPLNKLAALEAAGGDAALAERLLQAGGYDPATDSHAPNSLLVSASNDVIAGSWAEMLGADPAHLTDRITAIFEASSAATAVAVPGMEAVLAALKGRGLALGVATNDSEDSAYASLEPFGVVEHFTYVAGFDSGHGSKPGPGMVAGFCEATGLAPDAVAVVGDSHHDMEMGRSAGAGLLVGVLTGTGGRDDLAPHAHHVLDSILELEALLDALAGKRSA